MTHQIHSKLWSLIEKDVLYCIADSRLLLHLKSQYLQFLSSLTVLGLASLPVSIVNVCELILNFAKEEICFKLDTVFRGCSSMQGS